LVHITIGHADRLQHSVAKNSVPQKNAANIHSRVAICSQARLPLVNGAVYKQFEHLNNNGG
jgi:hypothetical protein